MAEEHDNYDEENINDSEDGQIDSGDEQEMSEGEHSSEGEEHVEVQKPAALHKITIDRQFVADFLSRRTAARMADVSVPVKLYDLIQLQGFQEFEVVGRKDGLLCVGEDNGQYVLVPEIAEPMNYDYNRTIFTLADPACVVGGKGVNVNPATGVIQMLDLDGNDTVKVPNMVIAGGAARAMLVGNGRSEVNDVDYFFYGMSVEEAQATIARIIKGFETIVSKASAFQKPVDQDRRIFEWQKTQHVTTFLIKDVLMNRDADGNLTTEINVVQKYQFIHRVYPSLGHIILGFDLDVCGVAITADGNAFFTEFSFFTALSGACIVDMGSRSKTFSHRLYKYSSRICFIFTCNIGIDAMLIEDMRRAPVIQLEHVSMESLTTRFRLGENFHVFITRRDVSLEDPVHLYQPRADDMASRVVNGVSDYDGGHDAAQFASVEAYNTIMCTHDNMNALIWTKDNNLPILRGEALVAHLHKFVNHPYRELNLVMTRFFGRQYVEALTAQRQGPDAAFMYDCIPYRFWKEDDTNEEVQRHQALYLEDSDDEEEEEAPGPLDEDKRIEILTQIKEGDNDPYHAFVNDFIHEHLPDLLLNVKLGFEHAMQNPAPEVWYGMNDNPARQGRFTASFHPVTETVDWYNPMYANPVQIGIPFEVACTLLKGWKDKSANCPFSTLQKDIFIMIMKMVRAVTVPECPFITTA